MYGVAPNSGAPSERAAGNAQIIRRERRKLIAVVSTSPVYDGRGGPDLPDPRPHLKITIDQDLGGGG